MTQDTIAFFGVDGVTGDTFGELTIEQAAELFAKTGKRDDRVKEQEARNQKAKNKEEELGFIEGVDAHDLGQTGWAVAWCDGIDPKIKEALAPLLERRRAQIEATRRPEDKDKVLFRELSIAKGETIKDLYKQARWGFAPGPVDPGTVPGYVMIVGPPSIASFDLQHDLHDDRFIGRLDLASVDDYAAYAEQLVASESVPSRERTVTFFGPKNPNDKATEKSCTNLVTPLANDVETWPNIAVTKALRGDAKKSVLSDCTSKNIPALLFAACHGAYVDSGAAEQAALQGALVTQEWAKIVGKPLAREARFAAEDVAKDSSLGGLVAVMYTCYGAGVTAQSRFPYVFEEGIKDLAPQPFSAALPRKLLACGAGAIVAPVERTWDIGYTWGDLRAPQLAAWSSLVRALVNGRRVGYAVDFLRMRYRTITAQLGMKLITETNNGRDDDAFPPSERAYLWMQSADSRGWIIHGDPAAKLAMPGVNEAVA